jgi:hypothetical protein
MKYSARIKQFSLQDAMEYEALPERMRQYIEAIIEDRLDEKYEEIREEIIDDIRWNLR